MSGSCAAMLAALLVFGADCGRSGNDKPVNAASEPTCQNVAIDGRGTRPACAAGVSSEQGPGVPSDFAGTLRESIPISQQERDAIAAANALANERAVGTSLDQGFGSPPTTVQQ